VELSNYSKILVIRLSSLGDILLTTPLLRTIKSKYPNIIIDFLLRKEYEDTLKYNTNINKLFLLNRDYKLSEIRSAIRSSGYDLIIDLQNNIRSRLITFGHNHVTHYTKPYLKRFLLVKFKINTYKNSVSISERYAQSVPGLVLDKKGLQLHLPEDSSSQLDNKQKYIGLCPGSRHLTKMWPKEYYIRLGRLLTDEGYRIVLFGGRDDRGICEEITDQISGAIDLSNDNQLLKLAANMKKCEVILCNDSGLMHTALALDIPVIAIFGSTVKEFGFFPYKGKNLVLENKSLSCRPCTHIGREKCPKEHMDCLKGLTAEYVFSELNRFLAKL
jgi:heptosyltransferase-2